MNLRNAKRSEDTLQINLMNWCRINESRYPELRWCFHIPNGGKRNKQEARHGGYQSLWILGGDTMTVEKLLKKLEEYAAQRIKRVTDDEGKYIKSVYDPEESKSYVVLNTSYDEDGSMTVDELISELKKCDSRKFVTTEVATDVIGDIFECLIEPTVVLLKS